MIRAALALVLAGCSAPATLSDLKTAEARADAGDVAGALAAYHTAQQRCGSLTPPRRARETCADALLGEGELLERTGQVRPAIEHYQSLPGRTDDPATAAIGLYRAGELLLRERDVTPAWTALWKVVTDYPDEPPAADAVRALLTDGRGRDARALADQLAKILTPLATTAVADNVIWSLADLDEHELANLPAARALYDQIPVDYPESGLRDDARWHAARLSRAMGDPAGAVTRLRALLATREVALGAGSYFSVWLDDAQLALGLILRDDLRDLRAAASAFRRLPEDYPASILKDDALYELAVTLDRAGDRPRACAAVDKLVHDAPDSKYVARAKELCR